MSGNSRTRKTKKQLEEEAAAEAARLAREEEEKAAAAAAAAEESVQLSKLHAAAAAELDRQRRQQRHPPDSPKYILFQDVISFCLPDSSIYPRSRGRLYLLAQAGPVSHRHNLTCLCTKCKQQIIEIRKTNQAAKFIWEGGQFTKGNLIPMDNTANENSASKSDEESKETASDLASTALASTALASAISPVRSPIRPSIPISRLLDSDFPFQLCPSCSCHVHSGIHLLSGNRGFQLMTNREIDDCAFDWENDELLHAMKCVKILSLQEKREFLEKLSPEKLERGHRPINRVQLMDLIKKVKLYQSQGQSTENEEKLVESLRSTSISPSKSLRNSSNPYLQSSYEAIPSVLLDFESFRTVVDEYRLCERAKLGEMYPDIVMKGLKQPPNPYNHVNMDKQLNEIPPIEYGLTKIWMEKSQWKPKQQVKGKGQLAASSSSSVMGSPKSGSGTGRALQRRVLSQSAEVLLSLPDSQKKERLPDYAVQRLNDRLLHRFTHEICSLNELKTPALVNNVHIMRSELQSNERMGWKS